MVFPQQCCEQSRRAQPKTPGNLAAGQRQGEAESERKSPPTNRHLQGLAASPDRPHLGLRDKPWACDNHEIRRGRSLSILESWLYAKTLWDRPESLRYRDNHLCQPSG